MCSIGMMSLFLADSEAQTLASSQAGDAGAAAFSNAVYTYDAVWECLGGRPIGRRVVGIAA